MKKCDTCGYLNGNDRQTCVNCGESLYFEEITPVSNNIYDEPEYYIDGVDNQVDYYDPNPPQYNYQENNYQENNYQDNLNIGNNQNNNQPFVQISNKVTQTSYPNQTQNPVPQHEGDLSNKLNTYAIISLACSVIGIVFLAIILEPVALFFSYKTLSDYKLLPPELQAESKAKMIAYIAIGIAIFRLVIMVATLFFYGMNLLSFFSTIGSYV